VPVAELLDTVDRTASTDALGELPRQRLVIEHPLKSFDRRNFEPGALGRPGPFGFDPLNLRGARALAGEGCEPGPFLGDLLDPIASPVVPLDALVRFVEHPVRAFLRGRLALYPGGDAEEVKDAIPIDLDNLERWQVGDRLLRARIAGVPAERAADAERARGALPPGILAQDELGPIEQAVDTLAAAIAGLACAGEPARSLPVHVTLTDGRVLVGAVSGVHGDVLVSVGYSKLGPRHRLAAWVRLLALVASSPDRDIASVTIARGRPRSDGTPRVSVSEFAPLDADPAIAAQLATQRLEVLVDLYDRGMREPLPLYTGTSAAWAEAVARGDDPVAAARAEWWTPPYESSFDKEDRDPNHVEVVGEEAPFSTLIAEAPSPDESGAGWATDESSRLGRLARRLWDPILASEEVTQR
jgi:exodeoxyribonuclease V gamma subunit